MQLGKRLSAIAERVKQSSTYNQVWDCCCDHGYLGAHFLEYYASINRSDICVNFVDQVPHITQQLNAKLKHLNYSNYEVHTLKAERLSLGDSDQHCLIIAGVTTTGTLKILQGILDNHLTQSLDVILCPTRGQFDLRQYLILKEAHLIHEEHIIENKRHYEIIHVQFNTSLSSKKKQTVSDIGEFWQSGNEAHLSYLNSKLRHYKKEKFEKTKLGSTKAWKRYHSQIEQTKHSIST